VGEDENIHDSSYSQAFTAVMQSRLSSFEIAIAHLSFFFLVDDILLIGKVSRILPCSGSSNPLISVFLCCRFRDRYDTKRLLFLLISILSFHNWLSVLSFLYSFLSYMYNCCFLHVFVQEVLGGGFPLYINYFCPSPLSIVIQALVGGDGLRLDPG